MPCPVCGSELTGGALNWKTRWKHAINDDGLGSTVGQNAITRQGIDVSTAQACTSRAERVTSLCLIVRKTTDITDASVTSVVTIDSSQ
jgi:hypothetical protein